MSAADSEWLSADSCAAMLDLRTRDGKVSRRAFLERVAVRSSFPAAVNIPGIGKRWPRAAVVAWMRDEEKLAAKRRAA